MNGYREIADVLDKIASDREQLVAALTAKLASEAKASAQKPADDGPSPLEKFASFYKKRTGEQLPENLRTKLSEPDMEEIVLKLADQESGERTPLGDAEDIRAPGSNAPTQNVARTERAKAAWDRFGQVLVDNHP
jgi:hypothetical protein